MFSKILVGYDHGDQAEDALALGRQLAGATGAELIVAHVISVGPLLGGRGYAHEEEDAADGPELRTIVSSSPAHGLHDLAEETEADLIVIGSASHGRIGQVLAGSTGASLSHGAPGAVAVAPKGYRDGSGSALSTIAVGVDGSPEAAQALAVASELASAADATLKLVTVSEPPSITLSPKGGNAGRQELEQTIDKLMRERLAEARESADAAAEATFIKGDPVDSLKNVAETPGTLLIVGSRSYGPVRRVLLGSVSTALLRSSPGPLMIIPRGTHARQDAGVAAQAEAVT